MSVLPIVMGADKKILRTVCKPVTEFDENLKKLVLDMQATMFKAKGVGIAAPQVGVDARVFLVLLGADTKSPEVIAMVNPVIVWKAEEEETAEEGCLSLPKQFGKVARAKEVRVEFVDLHGDECEASLTELDARIVQHELDHLNGVLFIDKAE